MRMSSLVAYEDSGDESEDPVVGTRPGGVRTGSGPHGHMSTTSTHLKLPGSAGCGGTGPLLDLQCDSPVSVPEWREVALPAGFSRRHELNPAKRAPPGRPGVRAPPGRPGVRPYVSKRQRLAEAAQQPTGHITESPPGQSQSILEVSDRLKPYLDGKAGAAEVPRRLAVKLEGHEGPVNALQWCPVPHLSHLLLSASMDKTFKVWDGAGSGRSLRVYTCHTGAVRDACWTPCGRRLVSGSFDGTAVVTDVETGQASATMDLDFRVTCVAVVPTQPQVFLCGGHSSEVKAWDSRCCKVVREYRSAVQQTLTLLFLRGDSFFLSSSDCVSRDSADRTLQVWDFQSGARISNQIFHERFTCPSLAQHPLQDVFVAQTNGNYLAQFSTLRPFAMNTRRRFQGHKVEGYAVRCGFSADGTILASGSSSGAAHFYDFRSTATLHTLQAHSQPCLAVAQHAVLPATAATGDWAGEIKVWN